MSEEPGDGEKVHAFRDHHRREMVTAAVQNSERRREPGRRLYPLEGGPGIAEVSVFFPDPGKDELAHLLAFFIEGAGAVSLFQYRKGRSGEREAGISSGLPVPQHPKPAGEVHVRPSQPEDFLPPGAGIERQPYHVGRGLVRVGVDRREECREVSGERSSPVSFPATRGTGTFPGKPFVSCRSIP